MRDKYRVFVLNNVPRLLSLLNRDSDHKTYGCFDRDFWNYRIRDFPSMILQQGSLTLALLYRHQFDGNIYYRNDKIKEWALGALSFWRSNQHSDGSFDEYYPNQHGYAPTVFTLYSTSETYRLLRKWAKYDTGLIGAIIKACRFVSRNREADMINQEIVSIAALYSAYLLLKEKWILNEVNKKLEEVFSIQSSEGWFPEFMNVDVGYLSVSLNYLAEYYRMSQDTGTLLKLKEIINFLQYFIHPNGTMGGDYGSRSTEYFLPNGLEIAAQKYPLAGALADKILKNLDMQKLPFSIDDRYLCHYFLHSYLAAYLNYTPRTIKMKLPSDRPSEKYFEDAQLYVLNTGNYYAVLGLNKGGILKIFIKNEEFYTDCGYRIPENNNSFYITNWNDTDYLITKSDRTLEVSGNFHRIKIIYPSSATHTLLRFGAVVLGHRALSKIRRRLSTTTKPVPIIFTRRIQFNDDNIMIKDKIDSNKIIPLLSSSERFSFRHVSSAKYFSVNDLTAFTDPITIKNVRKIQITKKLNILKKTIQIHIDQI